MSEPAQELDITEAKFDFTGFFIVFDGDHVRSGEPASYAGGMQGREGLKLRRRSFLFSLFFVLFFLFPFFFSLVSL
jgi:hypothetical protein